MARQRWSPDDDKVLVEGAGGFALRWFFARLKQEGKKARTRAAIYHRAYRLWQGGLRRGVFSLRQLQLETGYHPDQIRRAQSALNHRYKRLSPKGAYLISYDQREDLIAWLAHDFWAVPLRLYNCVWCHTKDRPHKGCGLCRRCYMRHRRLCKRLGVPCGIEAQTVWLERQPIPPEARSALCERLARGWALEEAWVKRLGKL